MAFEKMVNLQKNLSKMDEFPKDPAILMSFINMKLRDFYSNLDELCDDLNIDRQELDDYLAANNLEYNPELNKVW